jgi:hypothetical protein
MRRGCLTSGSICEEQQEQMRYHSHHLLARCVSAPPHVKKVLWSSSQRSPSSQSAKLSASPKLSPNQPFRIKRGEPMTSPSRMEVLHVRGLSRACGRMQAPLPLNAGTTICPRYWQAPASRVVLDYTFTSSNALQLPLPRCWVWWQRIVLPRIFSFLVMGRQEARIGHLSQPNVL